MHKRAILFLCIIKLITTNNNPYSKTALNPAYVTIFSYIKSKPQSYCFQENCSREQINHTLLEPNVHFNLNLFCIWIKINWFMGSFQLTISKVCAFQLKFIESFFLFFILRKFIRRSIFQFKFQFIINSWKEWNFNANIFTFPRPWKGSHILIVIINKVMCSIATNRILIT